MANNEKGFTLIEILIAMAITLFVGVSITGVFLSVQRSYTLQTVGQEVEQDLRAAVDILAHEIRLAGYDPDGSDEFAINLAQNNSIVFSIDRNADGTRNSPDCTDGITDIDLEQIGYVLDAANNEMDIVIYEDNVEVCRINSVLKDVRALNYTYWDGNNPSAQTAVLDDIRVVNIELTINRPAGGYGVIERTLSTQISCRNLGL